VPHIKALGSAEKEGNMAHGFANHGWRPDDYGKIVGNFHASASRSWCSADGDANGWRWRIYLIEDDAKIGEIDVGGVAPTLEAAQKAADEWIAAHLDKPPAPSPLEALRQIEAIPPVPFSRDRLEHANRTMEEMRRIARSVLESAGQP
jgi:hypothetical protein